MVVGTAPANNEDMLIRRHKANPIWRKLEKQYKTVKLKWKFFEQAASELEC